MKTAHLADCIPLFRTGSKSRYHLEYGWEWKSD